MTVAVWAKALAPWVGILIIAILNGLAREKALIPVVGALGGLIASGVILSGCILLVAFFAARMRGLV